MNNTLTHVEVAEERPLVFQARRRQIEYLLRLLPRDLFAKKINKVSRCS